MHMRDPNETGKALKARSRSPYLLWLIWVIWLPFITPAIIGLFEAHPTLLRLIATLVGITLFFTIYLWATWRNVQRLVAPSSLTEHAEASKWLPIAVLIALSLTLALLGNGNGWLTPFIFTSAYVAGRLPIVQAVWTLIALTLLAAAIGWLTDPVRFDLGQATIFTAVVGVVTISMVRSVTTGQELRAAREEIARLAVMTERLRIARDLHDLLGHNLSLIALKSELAGRLVRVAPERAAVEIGDIENVARTTLQEVREAVASYRQPTLSSELHAAQEILAAAGIGYQYESDESIMATLPTAIEAVLSWTVREGVTNVIRHSHAHQCTVRMTRDTYTAGVEVLDDGAASTGGTGSRGNGLRGLAERVEALGGQFDAGARVDGGFYLAVSLPLAQRNHDTRTPGVATAAHAPRLPEATSERTGNSGEEE